VLELQLPEHIASKPQEAAERLSVYSGAVIHLEYRGEADTDRGRIWPLGGIRPQKNTNLYRRLS
jgi:hypothetical protein